LPAPTEHLSDASRKRFEDLLEYLEMTETPYELARNLISRGNVWNDTCFEINAGGRRIAWGSHYGDFTRHFFPTSFSATGAVLQIASTGSVVKKAAPSGMRFSFVHIGNEAKRLSLRLAEDFRKARISITQNIGIESLTEQITLAERRASPYLLIMGRKEAMEGSAILRNRQTQEETILPLAGLIERLKAVA
jgi:histidyl-tRNA synthetase